MLEVTRKSRATALQRTSIFLYGVHLALRRRKGKPLIPVAMRSGGHWDRVVTQQLASGASWGTTM